MAATRRNRKSPRKSTRKNQGGGKRALTPWNKLVKRTYDEMKRKDRSASFGDALKEASKRKKAGEV